MEDWQHRKLDPLDGGRDHGVWQVYLSVDHLEADAVRRFGPQVVPAENFEIRTELGEAGEEGQIIFALRVLADTAADAVLEASFKLNKIRTAAGLPTGSPNVLGYISPEWSQDPAGHLAREAHALLKQGRDALAVIRTQTACELRIAATLEKLVSEKFPEVRTGRLIRRPATLADSASQELCHLLTGRRAQEEPWWPAYVEHRKRRNAIVHDGVSISHEDAQASIDSTIAVQAWLLELRGIDLGDM